jgi:hypothetical protein
MLSPHYTYCTFGLLGRRCYFLFFLLFLVVVSFISFWSGSCRYDNGLAFHRT